jgi:hypothetical protein
MASPGRGNGVGMRCGRAWRLEIVKEEARQVFDAVPGAKWFEEFPGVRHEAAVVRFHDKWSEAVRHFL